MKINSSHSSSLLLAALTLTLGLGCDKGDASKSGPDKKAADKVDDKAVNDKAVNDKAVDDKAVNDKAVDDKAVDDKAVDDKAAADPQPPGEGEAAPPAAANVIDDQSVITGVNRPGDGAFDTFEVHSGDKITFAGYEPIDADEEVGILAGSKYNMFMLTQPDKTQAFIVWSPDDPVWQDRLSKTDTVVTGIGSPGPNQLERGDKARISVQDAEGGGWDVTLDVYRGKDPVATFSFVVK